MDLSALDIPITEEEVWETIKFMPSDRAPGQMGILADFTRHVGR
jgi:hypothetical protein